MSRFRGVYNYSVDEKGRVNVPAKFRKNLAPEADETMVILRGPNRTLRAYPLDIWNRYEKELYNRPETPDTIRHKRLLADSMSDSKLDSQGRITLSAAQMAIGQVTKDVAVVGVGEYIEIWDSQRYRDYIEDKDDFDEVFFKSVEAGMRVQNG
ncbi:MAG: division/cell wall cluster transcriptional repressor MraZ [Chitinivibrionales bacterium]|nr:division/cell wall cluster transcriptional repressor MraZ [Chitinivibrionales bacterium]